MRNNRAPTFRATGAVDRQVPIYDGASAGPELWSALLRNPLPRDVIAGIKTHALENLAVSREKPNFPVLLFSPGFGATPTEYTALFEDIAGLNLDGAPHGDRST